MVKYVSIYKIRWVVNSSIVRQTMMTLLFLQMNSTRNDWSKVKKCCKRQLNMTLFSLTLLIMCSLPVIFYISTYLITKRQERNHAHLDDDEEGKLNCILKCSVLCNKTVASVSIFWWSKVCGIFQILISRKLVKPECRDFKIKILDFSPFL